MVKGDRGAALRIEQQIIAQLAGQALRYGMRYGNLAVQALVAGDGCEQRFGSRGRISERALFEDVRVFWRVAAFVSHLPLPDVARLLCPPCHLRGTIRPRRLIMGQARMYDRSHGEQGDGPGGGAQASGNEGAGRWEGVVRSAARVGKGGVVVHRAPQVHVGWREGWAICVSQ